MAKIGILTCSNATQDAGCSSFMCIRDVSRGRGTFDRYEDSGGSELAGIINCAGCPTSVAPEKLLTRVRSLTALGVDAIHLSACVLALCPFKNRYVKILRESFPHIDIVEGTHEAEEGAEEAFVAGMRQMLTQPQVTVADYAKEVLEQV